MVAICPVHPRDLAIYPWQSVSLSLSESSWVSTDSLLGVFIFEDREIASKKMLATRKIDAIAILWPVHDVGCTRVMSPDAPNSTPAPSLVLIKDDDGKGA